MPELPEVETVCRGLHKALAGERIESIRTLRAGLRMPFPSGLKALAGRRILGITRRAKYILMTLEGDETLIAHLGMSGRMTVTPTGKTHTLAKHDHLILTLKSGACVVLNDPRRFGLVALASTRGLEKHPLFAHLGPEPLEKEFTPAYLQAAFKTRTIAVKLALMDQATVVGVGNIYASEALFMAGIDPLRKACTLSPAETARLRLAVRAVLRAAIAAGGSSLRDYVQADGALGYFQHKWAVYGKAGERCKGCTCAVLKTGGIARIVQGGRATFFCPRKQH